MTVLVIEADMHARWALRDESDRRGHVMVEASTAAGGVTTALEERPDAILLGDQLGLDLDACAMAARLREHGLADRTPLFVVCDDVDGARDRLAGCAIADILPRTDPARALLDRIEAAIGLG